MLNIEKYKDEIEKLIDFDDYDLSGAIWKIMQEQNAGFESSILDWIYEEYKEPIITEKEREYLKAVCEPFWNKVHYICKSEGGWYTEIHYDNIYVINLPSFNGMFKNMEPLDSYTLEELGITYD